MWLKIFGFTVLAVVAIYISAFLYGGSRWKKTTQELRNRLRSARTPAQQKAVDFRELDDLPTPVQRYFRTVLEDGQPVITNIRIRHEGTFNTSETGAQWKPFTSEQWVETHRPGFLWNGRIAMLPGVPVRVHDAYVAGEGILHASVLGAVTVADLRGEDELAQGELMRYFAEAAWYPTALLPSQGVTWEAVDDRSAYGTLTDGATKITLLFSFNERGLIDTVRAEARGRTVDGEVVFTPWRGRFWNYEKRDGLLVPTEGEVAWLLPDGEQPYWRGHITRIHYELAQ